jgi:polyisoprenoid-binding protein YceI
MSLPSGTWKSDPIHSTVIWGIKHFGASTFRSSFKEFEATLEEGTLTGAAKVASMDIGLDTFKGHLLSDEFFAAESHPELTFKATGLTDAGEVTVPGELTIRGVTKPIEAKGTIGEPVPGMQGDQRIGVELATTIDRRDFGIDWQAELGAGNLAAGWDVKVEVVLELVQQ